MLTYQVMLNDYNDDTIDPEVKLRFNMFETKVQYTLDEVKKTYFHLDTYILEKLTQQENPWIEARCDLTSSENCCNILNNETIKIYYKDLMIKNRS